MIRRINLEPGTVIRGRWYGGEYRVIASLGRGGTARVYLVEDISSGDRYALKLSTDMAGIDREYRILSRLGPMDYIPAALNRDDCRIGGISCYFFVMTYFEGENLKKVCEAKRMRPKTLVEVAAVTAGICLRLNRRGVFYCDIKPENLVLDKKSGGLCLVDFGGAVQEGEAVVQFTPAFDRASWGRGQRIADEGYQGFAILMMLADLLLGGLRDTVMGFGALLDTIDKSQLSKGLKKVIIKGLKNDCRSLEELINSLRNTADLIPGGKQRCRQRLDAAINLGLLASIAFFIMVIAVIL
jgi:serine/threonine-protein kinase